MLGREKIPRTVVKGAEPVIIEEPKKETARKVIETPPIDMEVITCSNTIVEDKKPEPVVKQEKYEQQKTENIAGFSMETAIDCMICGKAFMQDWQHKEYNMCPSCRSKLNKLLNGESDNREPRL